MAYRKKTKTLLLLIREELHNNSCSLIVRMGEIGGNLYNSDPGDSMWEDGGVSKVRFVAWPGRERVKLAKHWKTVKMRAKSDMSDL